MVGEINIDNIMTKDTNKILFNARMCTQSIYNDNFSALNCIFFLLKITPIIVTDQQDENSYCSVIYILI